jgi:hypothetical protein
MVSARDILFALFARDDLTLLRVLRRQSNGKNNIRKGMKAFTMIAIRAEEKEAVSARFPDVHIVRTVKQKSKRHRYYCEETRRVVRFLSGMRNHSEQRTV